MAVYPGGTSQTCSQCGAKHKNSRASRSRFRCVTCQYRTHADRNAGVNIGDRELYYLQKQFGKTMETIRLARLGESPGNGKKDGAPAPVRGVNQPKAD